jgi:hypothetical protein
VHSDLQPQKKHFPDLLPIFCHLFTGFVADAQRPLLICHQQRPVTSQSGLSRAAPLRIKLEHKLGENKHRRAPDNP